MSLDAEKGQPSPGGGLTVFSYGSTVAWPAVAGRAAFGSNGDMVTGCPGEAALLNGSGSYVQPTPAAISAEAAESATTTPQQVVSIAQALAAKISS